MLRIAIMLLSAALALSLSAEEMGVVQGLIVDGETGEPLIGANLIVYDTGGRPAFGTTTDLDGGFSLRLPSGRHSIEISYVSYATKTVTGVEVETNGTFQLSEALSPEAIEVEAITVTARPERSSEVSMLVIQQKAGVVTDGISSELMSKASSSDAGDALKRVTGITVVGGRYVYVRGLGERYSNTQVNGAQMPSPEPNRRVVPMDIFPAGLLENIQVAKTFSPDQPGDFSGGSVQIRTKDFPDQLTLSLSASTSFHSQTSFEDIQSYTGGSWDFLGVDDGGRDLPELVKTQAAEQAVRKRGRFSTSGFTAEEIQTLGRSFNNVWSPETRTAPLNQSYSFSVGNALSSENRELGFVLSLTYDNSYRNGSQEWNSYRLTAKDGREFLSPFTSYTVSGTTNNVLLGALFNSSFRFSPLHKISLKTIYNRNTDDEARGYTGFNSDRGTDLRNLRLRFVERGVFTGQLGGEHHIDPLFKSNLNWQFGYAEATRDEPDNREVVYEMRNQRWTFFDITQSGSRFYFDLADREWSGKLDWTAPIKSPAGLPAKFKLGGVWRKKDRTFDARRFRFEQSSGIQRHVDLTADPEIIFAEENIAPGRFELRETTRANDNYSARQDLSAGYMMVDMPVAASWRLVTGVRVESSRQELRSFDPFVLNTEPIVVVLDNTDVLPGINLVRKLSDRSNLRAAYSRTLARPDFRELAPFEFTDFVGGRAVVGDTSLTRTVVDNYDLRWENFPRLGELAAFSVFYKKFHDPIEQIIQPTAQLRVSYANAASASNYGVEFEYRRRLDALVPDLEKFSVSANVTLVRSKVEIHPASGVQTSSERALQGQSPFVVNVMLGYDNVEAGASANLLYNVVGRRISEVGAQRLPDVFEQPRHQVDFTFKQRITPVVRLKLSAKNLLDSTVLYKQQEEVFTRYKRGRSISVGIVYDL